ncbi:hypothetical protein FACS1894182_02420 [Bacteroidia bacterium]|nr:hypothetical protein FACS1894182_02420 [Bacteroidia bacterium]
MTTNLFKSETFWGIFLGIVLGVIIGIILTFYGAKVQEERHQKYDKEKTDKETAVLLYNQMNNRFLWAQNVLTSSKSDVIFEDRWETYIKDGYMPWQVNKIRYFQLFENKNDTLSAKIKDVDREMGNLHDLLIKLRQKVLYAKEQKEKDDARFIAGKQNDKVKKLIEEINKELME